MNARVSSMLFLAIHHTLVADMVLMAIKTTHRCIAIKRAATIGTGGRWYALTMACTDASRTLIRRLCCCPYVLGDTLEPVRLVF